MSVPDALAVIGRFARRTRSTDLIEALADAIEACAEPTDGSA